jgi:hypothetical protein
MQVMPQRRLAAGRQVINYKTRTAHTEAHSEKYGL